MVPAQAQVGPPLGPRLGDELSHFRKVVPERDRAPAQVIEVAREDAGTGIEQPIEFQHRLLLALAPPRVAARAALELFHADDARPVPRDVQDIAVPEGVVVSVNSGYDRSASTSRAASLTVAM